ncbi:CCAAT- binding transcription factor component [Malassezia vespertilionis]|uniref:CCAAT- binding transcription factor component n=1 Tax=Malassezia vespertilionis TaxID=2020962 RepID=UPI0024B0963D|nr:CCAAT- binding transcription factor component [Malassezia vespertilionis]WFD05137.1 CCAAT- binding transcription factor component [Malassezia vespertilionis]
MSDTTLESSMVTVLHERIYEVLKDADLSVVSAKKIRTALGEMPDDALPKGLDLVAQKKAVDAEIRKCYTEVTKNGIPSVGAVSGSDRGSAKSKASKKEKAEPKATKSRKKRAATDDTDGERKNKRTASANSALKRSLKLSPAMAEVCGGDEMPRYEVVKQLWVYIKDKKLQDNTNKRQILCDDKLSSLFGKSAVDSFEMAKNEGHAMQAAQDDKQPRELSSLPVTQGGLHDIHQFVPLSSLIQQFSRNPAQFQRHFWRHQMDLVENGFDSDGKAIDFYNLGSTPSGSSSALPLARIKKVMKNDDEVKMISAEAPILFSRACEIFISDLTCRAFMVAEENKRRTIQRSDIASAIARSDLFDFLIDIVPRSDMVRNRSTSAPVRNPLMAAPGMPPGMGGADSSGRVGMNDAMMDPSKTGASGFIPLRPSQPEMAGRLDNDMGLNPTAQAMKGMHKTHIPGEWGASMYAFPPTGTMGDARVHPGPAIGMAPPHGRMARNPMEPQFMDANPQLSMGAPQSRGAFLNMVPYPMDNAKGDLGPAE